MSRVEGRRSLGHRWGSHGGLLPECRNCTGQVPYATLVTDRSGMLRSQKLYVLIEMSLPGNCGYSDCAAEKTSCPTFLSLVKAEAWGWGMCMGFASVVVELETLSRIGGGGYRRIYAKKGPEAPEIGQLHWMG